MKKGTDLVMVQREWSSLISLSSAEGKAARLYVSARVSHELEETRKGAATTESPTPLPALHEVPAPTMPSTPVAQARPATSVATTTTDSTASGAPTPTVPAPTPTVPPTPAPRQPAPSVLHQQLSSATPVARHAPVVVVRPAVIAAAPSAGAAVAFASANVAPASGTALVAPTLALASAVSLATPATAPRRALGGLSFNQRVKELEAHAALEVSGLTTLFDDLHTRFSAIIDDAIETTESMRECLDKRLADITLRTAHDIAQIKASLGSSNQPGSRQLGNRKSSQQGNNMSGADRPKRSRSGSMFDDIVAEEEQGGDDVADPSGSQELSDNDDVVVRGSRPIMDDEEDMAVEREQEDAVGTPSKSRRLADSQPLNLVEMQYVLESAEYRSLLTKWQQEGGKDGGRDEDEPSTKLHFLRLAALAKISRIGRGRKKDELIPIFYRRFYTMIRRK